MFRSLGFAPETSGCVSPLSRGRVATLGPYPNKVRIVSRWVPVAEAYGWRRHGVPTCTSCLRDLEIQREPRDARLAVPVIEHLSFKASPSVTPSVWYTHFRCTPDDWWTAGETPHARVRYNRDLQMQCTVLCDWCEPSSACLHLAAIGTQPVRRNTDPVLPRVPPPKRPRSGVRKGGR